MFEQRTVIDQIEITRDGEVRLRLDKQLLRDGIPMQEPRYHRCSLEPGADLDVVREAVDAHLVSMRESPVVPEDWERVREVVVQQHKPEVVSAWIGKRRAAEALLKLQRGVSSAEVNGEKI